MAIPRLRDPDATLRFLRDGYLFGARGFRDVGGDAFRTRLLGRDVIVARGVDATRFFAEQGRFTRRGAMPRSARHLLQDDGSVQLLDGDAHAERKGVFLDLVAAEHQRAALADRYRQSWGRLAREHAGTSVSAIDVAALALTEAALDLLGIPEGAERTRELSDELSSMVDGAGRFGAPNWAARARRLGTESWARDRVERARTGPDDGRGIQRIVRHRDGDALLPPEIAAVELLNVLRPIVAVSLFVGFAALALHAHPAWRDRIAAREPGVARAVAQEIRRRYPFFPVIGGRSTRPLEWRDAALPAGQWMLLDLYGTDHDPALWPDPDRFDPQRFLADAVAGHRIVAQGAGDLAADHRCPGEPATVDLLVAALEELADGPAYSVPDQDLRISLRRMPARPEDGMRVAFA